MSQYQAQLLSTPEKILVTKKLTCAAYGNMTLMLNLLKWSPLDIFWQDISNPMFKIYIKYQSFLKEYKPAAKRFLACLFFII